MNVDDDVLSLSVISKSINTSYINLKRHNPWQRELENNKNKVREELCPELTIAKPSLKLQ